MNEPAVELPFRFAQNITGFVRRESAVAFNLSMPVAGSTSPAASHLRSYLDRLDLSSPLLHPLDTSALTNLTSPDASSAEQATAGQPGRNETLARELRGSFPWLATTALPPSIWTDQTVAPPAIDSLSVPPRTHSLALTLREGLWGHAYNHPERERRSATQPLPLKLDEDGHRWTNVKGSLDMTTEGSDGDVQQSWTVQGCHDRQNGTLYLLGSVECVPLLPARAIESCSCATLPSLTETARSTFATCRPSSRRVASSTPTSCALSGANWPKRRSGGCARADQSLAHGDRRRTTVSPSYIARVLEL